MTFPRGAFPSPRHRLAAATPHTVTTPTPPCCIYIPSKLSFWLNNIDGDCCTAEEAFAKATHQPEILISDFEVGKWASAHGFLNGASLYAVLEAMTKAGFAQAGNTYNDGPFNSVDWTNAAILRNAIALGPVKVGVAAAQLENVVPNPPKNGWFATGFTPDPNEDHCPSLCGYGPINWLLWKLGAPPVSYGKRPGYAMFTWDSIGVIDVPSMLAITGEAWLRRPTTVIITG